MKTLVLTIGDELLIGQVINTNASWIAARLNEAGARVVEMSTVADNAEAIAAAVRQGLDNFDMVISTGGLGPTKDDITKNVLCDIFGCGLVRDDATYERVEMMLAERGTAMNELNRDQALVPEFCTPMVNRNGTAPGMWFERDRKVLAALPGVPFEMRELMNSEVLPRMERFFGLRSDIVHKTVVTYGIPEAELALLLEEWESSLPVELHLAYLPGPNGMRLRLSAYDADGGDARTLIHRELEKLKTIIPANIVGYGDATLESSVAEQLVGSGLTLSVAESCTGGALAARFTAMSGASEYFLGGAVAYSNHLKTELLGVNPADIEMYGAVSQTVAEQMAVGIRRVSCSDYSIAVTGIAGPDGGTPEKPVGTVWIAVAGPQGVVSRKKVFGKLRDVNISRAASTAIDMLRMILSGYEIP